MKSSAAFTLRTATAHSCTLLLRMVAVLCMSLMLNGCLGMGSDKSGANASVDGDLPGNPSQMGTPGAPNFTTVSATASASEPAPSDAPAPQRRGSTGSVPGHARIQPGPSMVSPALGAPKETVMAAKPVPVAKARKEDVRRAAPVVDTQAPALTSTTSTSTAPSLVGTNSKHSTSGALRTTQQQVPATSMASASTQPPLPRTEQQPVFDYTPPAKYTATSTGRKGPRPVLSKDNPSQFINRNSYTQGAPSAPLPRGEANDPRYADGNSLPPQYENPPLPPPTNPNSTVYNGNYSNSRQTPRYTPNQPPLPPPSSSSYQESIAGSGDAGNSGDSQLPTTQNTTSSYTQHPSQPTRYAPPPSMPGGPEFPRKIAPNDQEVAVITTAFGDVVIQLEAQAAPQTVANFMRLIADGFYDGTTFHRTIPNFVIQGGDPNSKLADRTRHGLGGPDYTIPAEITSLKHIRGAVAMARGRDEVNPTRASNGSQFYICVNNNPALNSKYTVFGRVIKGMDVVDAISMQPRDNRDNPLDSIKMQVVMKKRSEIQGL